MRRLSHIPLAIAAALLLSACGTNGIEVAESDSASIKRGAEIFNLRCSGCHTLEAAGAEGSAMRINSREYKDGPNFNQRTYDENAEEQILYAIRNGGFSSGPMPQNLAVGQDARDVAAFVAKYAGSEASRGPSEGKPPPAGLQDGGGENSPPPRPKTSPTPTPEGADEGESATPTPTVGAR